MGADMYDLGGKHYGASGGFKYTEGARTLDWHSLSDNQRHSYLRMTNLIDDDGMLRGSSKDYVNKVHAGEIKKAMKTTSDGKPMDPKKEPKLQDTPTRKLNRKARDLKQANLEHMQSSNKAMFRNRKFPGQFRTVTPSTKIPGAHQVTTWSDKYQPLGDFQVRNHHDAAHSLAHHGWEAHHEASWGYHEMEIIKALTTMIGDDLHKALDEKKMYPSVDKEGKVTYNEEPDPAAYVARAMLLTEDDLEVMHEADEDDDRPVMVRDKRDGQRKILMHTESDDHTSTVTFAFHMYSLMGVKVPPTEPIVWDEKRADLQNYLPSAKHISARDLARSQDVLNGFSADVYLNNTSVVDTSGDRIVATTAGHIRTDAMGALDFDTSGAPKSFDEDISILETMRRDEPTASVFGDLQDNDVVGQIDELAGNITPEAIDRAMDSSDYPEKRREPMKQVLLERLQSLKDWADSRR